MPGPQRMSGEAFAIERLREDPNLDYAALRREAAEAGVALQPIQYGRARKQLGLPPLRAAEPARSNATGLHASATHDDSGDEDDGPADARGAAAEPHDVEPGDEPAHDVSAPQAGAGTRSARDDDNDTAGEAAGDREAEPRGDLVAPRRKGSAAFDFLVQELRREPGLAYAELRDRCTAKGWKVAPIMYGRAKAVLGLVPVKPRGTGKKGAAAPLPPRTLKQVESVAADRFSRQLEEVRNLDQLVAVVKELDAERRRLRDLLERVVAMIDEAL